MVAEVEDNRGPAQSAAARFASSAMRVSLVSPVIESNSPPPPFDAPLWGLSLHE
jgi:hypothetical protein